MNRSKIAQLACALGAAALMSPLAGASTVQINIQGAGGTVTGGPSLVQSLFNTTRFDAQFVIRNFDPTGYTGTVSFDGQTSDDGVEFLLHLNTLETIEGALFRTGPDPRSDEINGPNSWIILPRTAGYTDAAGTGFFGAGSVSFVNGVLVGFEYSIGADALAGYDFLFDNANIDASLEEILISSGPLSLGSTFIADGADPNADTPYGLNTTGYTTEGTDNTTTRFEATDPQLCTQIWAGNLCLGTSDPLNNVAGLNPMIPGDDLYLYTLGGQSLEVTAIPLPAAFWLFASAVAGLGLRARRRT